MKMFKSILSLVLVASVATMMSCSKSDPTPAQPLNAVTVTNFAADPPTVFPTNGPPHGTGKYSLFSFKTGAQVANADSATVKWDIGFNATTIVFNSGSSGPGTASGQLMIGAFADITTAPDAGYRLDSKPTYAVPTGSDNGWYHYNGSTNVITPLAGRTIIVQTADSKFAKIEILNFYKDAPASPTSASLSGYYTFRYIYQADGSKKLQ
jgi:hypothetical protein